MRRMKERERGTYIYCNSSSSSGIDKKLAIVFRIIKRRIHTHISKQRNINNFDVYKLSHTNSMHSAGKRGRHVQSEGIQMKLFRGDSSNTTPTIQHMCVRYVIPCICIRSSYDVHFKNIKFDQSGMDGEHRDGKMPVCLLWKASRRKIDLIRLMRLCKHEMLSDTVISTQCKICCSTPPTHGVGDNAERIHTSPSTFRKISKTIEMRVKTFFHFVNNDSDKTDSILSLMLLCTSEEVSTVSFFSSHLFLYLLHIQI